MAGKKLKGIKGWLLCYILFLSFRLILDISLVIIFQVFNILLAIEVFMLILALITMIFKLPKAKIINLTYLIISAILAVFVNFNKLISDNIQDRTNGISSIIGATIASILLIIYLINSKRVRNTLIK